MQSSLFAQSVAPPFPGRPSLIKIAPRRAGRWGEAPEHGGIVGKVIVLPRGFFAFFTRQKYGTKPHRNSGCPFPVDDLISRWAVQEGISPIATYDGRGKRILWAESSLIQHAPAQVYDGSLVHLLPLKDWQVVEKVYVREEDGEHRYFRPDGRLLLAEPYLELKKGDPEVVLFDPEEL